MTRLVIRLRVGDKKVSGALRPCNAVRPQMIALGADSQLKQLRGLYGGSRRAVEGAEPTQGVLQARGRHAIEAAHPAYEPTVVRVHVFPINPFTQVKLGACVFAGFFICRTACRSCRPDSTRPRYRRPAAAPTRSPHRQGPPGWAVALAQPRCRIAPAAPRLSHRCP